MSYYQLALLTSIFLFGSLAGMVVVMIKEFYLAKIHDEWEWDEDCCGDIDPITGFPRRSDM